MTLCCTVECKAAEVLLDKHMVKMIMEVVQNQSFIFTTSDSKQSKLHHVKNGAPQESVLAPLLFNIYRYHLPSMISKKFAYADDLALLHSSENWKDLEGTFEPRHFYTFSISPDLEVEAQSH